MGKIESVAASALRDALADAPDAKAAKRLTVALAYKDGVSVDTLSERYGIPRSTVYAWLDRFEERPIPEAIRDEDRPGRPALLADRERAALASALGASPADAGFEASSWTPELVREHVERTYGVVYSLGHARRLLRELPSE